MRDASIFTRGSEAEGAETLFRSFQKGLECWKKEGWKRGKVGHDLKLAVIKKLFFNIIWREKKKLH